VAAGEASEGDRRPRTARVEAARHLYGAFAEERKLPEEGILAWDLACAAIEFGRVPLFKRRHAIGNRGRSETIVGSLARDPRAAGKSDQT
jgi:hypothetical protein